MGNDHGTCPVAGMAMSSRSHGVKPKFKVGDIVFIPDKNMRVAGATFTVAYREWDNRIRTWFYRDANGPLYVQSELRLAAPAQAAKISIQSK